MRTYTLHITFRILTIAFSLIASKILVWFFDFRISLFQTSIMIAIVSGIPFYSRNFQLYEQNRYSITKRIYYISLDLFHTFLVFTSIYAIFKDLGNIDLISVFLGDFQSSQSSESMNILLLFIFVILTTISSALAGFLILMTMSNGRPNYVVRKLFMIRDLRRSEIDSWIYNEL